MPAKRPLWENRTIIINYLINIIHLQASLAITPARASGTAVEKRDSANLSYRAIYGLPNQLKFFDIQEGIKIFYPKKF
jgi:hypothetical protein